MPSIPSVVIHFDFYNSDNPEWVIKGEVNKNGEINNNNDYSDYCEREEAFKNENLKMSEYDYYDYSGNKEKSDGNFDITTDVLSEKQIDEYRKLEMQSKQNDCIKYLDYIAFDNDFLQENKIINNSILNTKKLRNIIRSAMSDMIFKSKKLDESNTVSLIDNNKMPDYINYRIGKMYSLGYGTEQDYKKAFEYFMKAPNNKYAQFSIGSLYQYGNGVEQSDDNAFHYYKLSADQGKTYLKESSNIGLAINRNLIGLYVDK